jgi:DNA-binding CsgD family transcriptional regulator
MQTEIAKERTLLIQEIYDYATLEKAVVREFRRYLEMRPSEVDGYITVLTDEINNELHWSNQDEKLASYMNNLINRQYHLPNWYKIVYPLVVPGLNDLSIDEIIAAFYFHVQDFKDWMSNQIKKETKTGLYDEKDFEILSLKRDGFSDEEVAKKVFLSPQAVKQRLSNLRFKYDCGNKTATLIAYLVKEGVL